MRTILPVIVLAIGMLAGCTASSGGGTTVALLSASGTAKYNVDCSGAGSYPDICHYITVMIKNNGQQNAPTTSSAWSGTTKNGTVYNAAGVAGGDGVAPGATLNLTIAFDATRSGLHAIPPGDAIATLHYKPSGASSSVDVGVPTYS
jgi:hypothetical protein